MNIVNNTYYLIRLPVKFKAMAFSLLLVFSPYRLSKTTCKLKGNKHPSPCTLHKYANSFSLILVLAGTFT